MRPCRDLANWREAVPEMRLAPALTEPAHVYSFSVRHNNPPKGWKADLSSRQYINHKHTMENLMLCLYFWQEMPSDSLPTIPPIRNPCPSHFNLTKKCSCISHRNGTVRISNPERNHTLSHPIYAILDIFSHCLSNTQNQYGFYSKPLVRTFSTNWSAIDKFYHVQKYFSVDRNIVEKRPIANEKQAKREIEGEKW